MSLQEVERVMQRALRDEAFRVLLREDPAAALAAYDLTPDERALLLGHPTPPDAPAAPPAGDRPPEAPPA
jgi:hypothetical protein